MNTLSTFPLRHHRMLQVCVVPGESVGVSSGPSVFRVHRFIGPMRQVDGLQTFFVDPAVQADVDSNPRR